jgi:hypothetical protein
MNHFKLYHTLLVLGVFILLVITINRFLFPSATATPNRNGFRKLLFNPETNFFEDNKYPQFISKKTSNDLIGLKCTEPQEGKGQLQKCETEQGMTLAINRIPSQYNLNIGYFQQEDNLKILATTQVKEAYFDTANCFNPLYLTKENTFYFQCNYHSPIQDGARIYEANLNNGIIKQVYECRYNIKTGRTCT